MSTDRAEALIGLGRHSEALTEARNALTEDPNDSNALYMMSVAQIGINKPAEALKTARRGMANDSYHVGLQISEGQALTRLERFEEAHTAYDRALRLGPIPFTLCKFVDSITRDPATTKRSGKDLRAKAQKLADSAVEMAPDSASSHVALAKARMVQNDAKGAERAIRKALSIDANDAIALQLLGLIQQSQGQLRQAGDSYVASGRANPQGSSMDNLHSLGKVAAPLGMGTIWIISRVVKTSGKGAAAAGAPIAIVLVIMAIALIALWAYHSANKAPKSSPKANYNHLSPEAQRIIKQDNDLR